jgi:biopolymer transport protein ExbB
VTYLLLAAAAAPASSSPLETIQHFFIKGGVFMVPIGLCSLAAVTLMILRAFALRREAIIPRLVESEIGRFQAGDNVEPLAHLVGGDLAPMSKITRVALGHLRESKSDNLEAVQTSARVEVSKMESGLAALELIVGIGPMLGLLGAISGLVRVFANLGSGATNASDTLTVALGIAEALNTTIFGLVVAIPSLIAFTYFQRRVESLATEMEALVGELLSKCYQPARSTPTAPAAATEPRKRAPRVIESYEPEPAEN